MAYSSRPIGQKRYFPRPFALVSSEPLVHAAYAMAVARVGQLAFEPRVGARLHDRYELEARIGEGGMGEVWRARDLSLRRQVAIKFLSGALALNEGTRNRFLVEAQLTAQLNTRHAVHVYDFGVTGDGQPYFVLELLHGETLAKRLERTGKLDAKTTVTILKKAARALSRAHAMRIVHRDFKPDNVFLTVNEEGEDQEEDVKVVDFGIAKMIGSLEGPRPAASLAEISPDDVRSLTRTNTFIGTPQYMSPEQIEQTEVGPPVDVWALGIVAFECLTGAPPFTADTLMQLFAVIQCGVPISAHHLDPAIPEAFDTWFRKATAHAPEDRFADPNQAISELAIAILPGSAITPSSGIRGPSESERRRDDVLPFASTLPNAASQKASLRDARGALVEGSLEAAGLPKKRSLAAKVVPAVCALAIIAAAVVRVRGEHGAANVPEPPPSNIESSAASNPDLPSAPPPATSATGVASATPPIVASATSSPAAPKASASAAKVHTHGSHEVSPAEPNHDIATSSPPIAIKSSEPVPEPPPPAPPPVEKPAPSASSPYNLPPLGL